MPTPENFNAGTVLNESLTMLLPQALTNPTVERRAMMEVKDPRESKLLSYRAAGFLNFESTSEAAVQNGVYHHVEVGRATSHIEFGSYAAPGVGNDLVLTVIGPFGSNGSHPAAVGDRYYVNGIVGKVTLVQTAPLRLTLQAISGLQWPAGNAGIGLFLNFNPGEGQYSPTKALVTDVALYDHIVEEVGFGIKLTNYVMKTPGEWVQAPNIPTPWRAIPTTTGWINYGMNEQFNNFVEGLGNQIVLGQRPGTVRAAGDPHIGDGVEETVLNNGIIMPYPTTVTRQWFKDYHSALNDIVNGSRDIRIVGGVDLVTQISDWQRSEMNGQTLVDRSAPYDFLYSAMKGLYGNNSTFSYMNFVEFDDEKGFGSMGWRKRGFSTSMPDDSIEYTDRTSRKPGAMFRIFRPANSAINPSTDSSIAVGSFWNPIHWGKMEGLSMVENGASFTNPTEDALVIQAKASGCVDIRNADRMHMVI